MAQSDQCQLHQKLFIARGSVVEVDIVQQVDGPVEPFRFDGGCALSHFGPHIVGGIEQRQSGRVLSHHKVAQILGQAVYKEERVEAAVAHILYK